MFYILDDAVIGDKDDKDETWSEDEDDENESDRGVVVRQQKTQRSNNVFAVSPSTGKKKGRIVAHVTDVGISSTPKKMKTGKYNF